MEDLKHTPGKWNPCNPGDYSDYEGQSIVIEGDDERLAVVLGDDRTAIANARLIAAAPEMFEALKKLRLSAVILLQNAEGCAVNHYGVDYSVHGEPGWLRDCRATIETRFGEPAASPREAPIPFQTGSHQRHSAAADTTDTAGATHQGAPITADIAHSTAVNAAPKNTPRL